MEKQIGDINKAVMDFSNRWDETKKVTEDLQKNIANLQSSTAAIKKKQQDIKESIRELVSVAETEASHLQELNTHTVEPQMKALKTDVAKTDRLKDKLDKELADVTTSITHKEEMLKNLHNQASSSNQELSASMSRIRAEYSLYSNLFNIKWDHAEPDNHIKGFVFKSTEKRIVPFKFDKTSHSQFFITNYLWEQISAGICLDDSLTTNKA